MSEQMIELTPIAAAVVDIWMGGDKAWRSRLHDSDFLESADWQNAMEIARAAHSVIAGKVAELEEARDALRSELEHERASRMHWQVRAALAPYPERRSE